MKVMKVVIAEKPSVARELAKILKAASPKDGYMEGNGYAVTWAIGHLAELAPPEAYGFEKWRSEDLPMLPERFKLKISDDKGIQKQFNVIKSLFEQSEEIIVATDAGREGELIFRYIYTLSGVKKPFRRLWISSQTEAAVKEGFERLRPGTEYDNLYAAAKARSEADWLVGMNATRALTLSASAQKVLSVGRVQSPVLAMVCSRYLEHKNFKPEAFFEVTVDLEKDGKTFKAKHPKRFSSSEEAEKLAASVSATALCTKAEKKAKTEAAPLLFDLTALQREANAKYGYSAQKTLELAQELYEKHKLITYPRTGSRYISDDVFAEVPKLLENLRNTADFTPFAEVLLKNPLSKKPVDNKKVTDHHALLPTETDPGSVTLGEETKNIYETVTRRFLAAFFPPCEKEVTALEFMSGEVLLKSSGSIIKSEGWRSVEKPAKDRDEENEEDTALPDVFEKDVLPVKNKDVAKGMTKPKPLHTESSLLALMETAGKELEDDELKEALKDSGIGTPATRASIIETLFKRQYLERDKKKIIPTETGLKLYDLISEKSIAKAELTGAWEKELRKMERGEVEYEQFMENIKSYARRITEEMKEGGKALGTLLSDDPFFDIQTSFPCPKCQTGRLKSTKLSLVCEKNVPENRACDFVIWKSVSGKVLSLEAVKALLEGKPTEIIKGFKSKDGKTFDAFIELDEQKKMVFKFPKREVKTTEYVCPKCGKGRLTESDKALGCSERGACDFVVWKTVSGKTLNDKIIDRLLRDGRTDFMDGFTGKSGNKFRAALELKDHKVSFVFEEKKPKN